MQPSTTRRRVAALRTVGWFSVASMLALALLVPAAGAVDALSGAIFTSTFDGSTINGNIYALKADVYLTGGPCQGGSHLPAGTYLFEVDSPNGVLLSSDAIGKRTFTVGANGFIVAADPSHVTHAVSCVPPGSGITVQLLPYLDTPNPGGEYKLVVATASSVAACPGFDAASSTFRICLAASQKSDNFKVREPASPVVTEAPPPTAGPTEPRSGAPTQSAEGETTPPTSSPGSSPTAPPTQEVGGATGAPSPALTLPPTDILSRSTGASDAGWRVMLVAGATLLASILVLSPSRSRRRR